MVGRAPSRGGACRGAEGCWIERAAPRGDQDKGCDTATDLKPARMDVLVWQAVAREVEDRFQEKRREPGPAGGAGRGARRHMECDDHGCGPTRC